MRKASERKRKKEAAQPRGSSDSALCLGARAETRRQAADTFGCGSAGTPADAAPRAIALVAVLALQRF